jgi:DNA-binding MarR family transcriptional regulator
MAVTADLDLTLSQGRILLELERTGEALAGNDLASRISLSIAAAGRAIDALYRSGLLTRREDEIDRRIKRIGLTDRGSIVIAEILHVRRQVAERFVSDLNDDERIALEGAVATIAALTPAHFRAICGSCDSTSSSKERSA